MVYQKSLQLTALILATFLFQGCGTTCYPGMEESHNAYILKVREKSKNMPAEMWKRWLDQEIRNKQAQITGISQGLSRNSVLSDHVTGQDHLGEDYQDIKHNALGMEERKLRKRREYIEQQIFTLRSFQSALEKDPRTRSEGNRSGPEA